MCLIKAFFCSVLWDLTLNSVCHGPQFVSKMSSVCHGPQFVCKMSSHENLFKPNKTITIV